MYKWICRILQQKRKMRMFRANAELKGSRYTFGRAAYVSLLYGSCQSDITIGNNFTLHGALQSQSGGKIQIGDNVWIGVNSNIQSVNSVIIGGYTRISNNVFITDNNNHPVNPMFTRFRATQPDGSDCMRWCYSSNSPVKIGENCWIGQYVRIQKGVTIGNNCIIAANSVLTKDVPDNCIAAGNPAKIVKTNINDIPYPDSCEEFNEWIKLQ